MSPKKSTSQSSISQCSKIPRVSRCTLTTRDSLNTSPTPSHVLPLNKSRNASSPCVSGTRGKPNDSDSNSTPLSSPSHSECIPSSSHPSLPNSPHQFSLTINSAINNQNSQHQSRKRSKIVIGQRSEVPFPIDTHGRSNNLNVHQNLYENSSNKNSNQNTSSSTEDKSQLCSSLTEYSSSLCTEEPVTFATRKAHIENNVDNLMNDLQISFNITRMVINNHRSFIESKLKQMTQQCEKLSISLNDSK
ncbi:hypothetical protein ACI65C_005602 [Semiaphis heraclei]